MEPLIGNFTKNLQPCGGCGKTDLASPEFDWLWADQPKGEKEDGTRVLGKSDEANSDKSSQPGGSD